jgi:hypothetical protein
VDEHGHLLVLRVGAEEEVTLLVLEVLNVLIAQTLEAERELFTRRTNGLAHIPSSFSSSPPPAILYSLCLKFSLSLGVLCS